MTLPTPNLDDRTFQQLVDQAKQLVQRRCPEWSDHNVSDPGVTLIEAFATMVDQLIYRLNRVPEKNYLAFLDLIGVRLFPPTAARADVTFWLSAPQPDTVRVPAGTQVATVRTETQEAVVFSTARDLAVVPCERAYLATGTAGGSVTDRTAELRLGRDVPCFGATPQPGDCLYVGLSAAVPGCAVVLRLDCQVHGVGVDPSDPPLRWEALCGDEWLPCEVDKDDTGGFNKAGEVVLHVPEEHAVAVRAGVTAGWVRCRLVTAGPGRPTYVAPPTVRQVSAFTIGGTVEALHAESVAAEVLGAAEGLPGQTFYVARPPVEPTGAPFVVEVAEGEGWARWQQVDDFAHSTWSDRHFTLDPGSGRVDFGPAVHQPDGTARLFGAVPPKDATVRVRGYRTGGGRRGNVSRGALRILRSSVPFVARVQNRRAAVGGVDGETVDNARVRGPLTLRTLHRAVVAEDYERLAREVAPGIARVRCLSAAASGEDPAEAAGGVRLLVVPAGRGDAQGRIDFRELEPPTDMLSSIASYLHDRCPVGTRLNVEPPFYQGMTVAARVQAVPGTPTGPLRDAALAALYHHFSPLTGGTDDQGWPFGRPVHAGEVFAVLQRVPGVELVEDVKLFPADPYTGERTDPVDRLELAPNSLVFSYSHDVQVQVR
jgi:predicted phage baseplate assembly protein